MVDGDECWFNDEGELIAHYPEMILAGVLCRILNSVTQQFVHGVMVESNQLTLPEPTIDHLQDLIDKAWPIISRDTPEQYDARLKVVKAFREENLLP